MIHRDEYWGRAREAAKALRARGCGDPFAAVQCGSGLGPLVAGLWPEEPEAAGGGRCAFTDVPHLAGTAVVGHGTELLWGDVPGPDGTTRRLLVFSGRLHMYEGHSALEAAFPVAVSAALGCGLFLLTNAAGGLNQHFAVGDAMVQRDYINMQGDNPLLHLQCPPPVPRAEAAPGSIEYATRFTDPKPAYHPQASALLARQLAAAGLGVNEGVYIGIRGPVYETRAELVMYRGCGADAIGMSSVQELTMCHFLGLPACGVSIITNECFSTAPVTHADVVAASHKAAGALGQAIRAFAAEWTG